ncbi:MAG: winged helix-turn-helix transcriptional regulator [Thaumarchaeota archaeon]|nr:winged helix-turn-helix transcriptional regulator [Nitrososphaerota archaeon]
MKENDDEVAAINPSEKTEILSTADEKIKILGELLSSDSSREIINLLFENEMTATQIAQKTEMSIQLVKHYINKMQDVGIAEVSKIVQNGKGHDMKYYRISKIAVIILPPKLSEKAKKTKSLFNALTRVYRFAAIGVSAVSSWFVTQFVQQQIMEVSRKGLAGINGSAGGSLPSVREQMKLTKTSHANSIIPSFTPIHIGAVTISPELFLPIVVTASVIIAGIMVEVYARKRKNMQET